MRSWLALAGLCLGFFMMMLDSTIVSVALPDISRDLNVSTGASVWVNSAYLFAYAVPLLVTGRLGDRLGHRPVYLVGLAVFTMASAGCAFAGSLGSLVAWRAAQGLGAAILTPQCLTVIRQLFEPPLLAIALAVWSAGGGAASAAGPLVGGVLVGAWGWPAVFLVNLPFGVLTVAAVVAFVPRSARVRVSFSAWAVVGLLAGVFAVILGAQGTDTGIAAHPWARALLVAGGLAVVAGVLVAQRSQGTRALVPLGLFHDRGFVAGSLGAAFASFCVGSAAIPLMLALQEGRGMSVTAASLVLAPMGVACLLVTPFVGRATNGGGPRFTAVFGAVLLTAAVAATAALLAASASVWAVAAAFAAFGVANAFVWSPFSLSAMLCVQPSAMGAASGVFNALKQLGAVVGSAVTAIALAAGGPVAALAALAAAGACAVLSACALPGRYATRELRGRVVHGAGVGAGLGFPTANIEPLSVRQADGEAVASAADPTVPADGVYLGVMRSPAWDGKRAVLVSVGRNETFPGRERTVEVHVLDFTGDLYGLEVELTFGRRLRRQRRFAGSVELSAAMRRDEARARGLLAAG